MSWYYAENNDRKGPIDETAFQDLVRGGTIKPDTLVWREGMANWTPYSQVAAPGAAPVSAAGQVEGGVRCSQCGGVFPASDVIFIAGRSICATCKPRAVQQMVEGADAAGSTIDPEKLLAEVRARGGYNLEIGTTISHAWQTVKKNLWPCIGTAVLVYFVMMAGQQCLSLIGTSLIMGPCFGGLYYYFIKQLRNEPAVLGDAFLGFKKPHWGQLALVGTMQTLIVALIAGILIAPAFFLFMPKIQGNPGTFPPGFIAWCFVAMIPVFYLTTAWILSYAFVIDKGLKFWPAMELSRKLVNMRFGSWFGLMLVNGLLAMAGTLALCVGVLFVLPVSICSIMVVYEDILATPRSSNP